jgi:hypothetical protein
VRIGTSPKGMIFVATISDKQVLRSMNRLIHSSAWNKNSANFAFKEFPEVGQDEERGATKDKKRPRLLHPGPRRCLRNGALYEVLILILRSRAKYSRWRSP